jgi:CPA1 family monovalent cation:H+ antiporter
MTTFALLAILVTITALLSYLNERYLRLPPAIGVMTAALGVSMVLILLGQFGLAIDDWAEGILRQVDFNAVLMEGGSSAWRSTTGPRGSSGRSTSTPS